jgi:anti-sigma factor RsiW
MMDHEQIKEEQIIDRYLMNRLNADEFEAFTNHFPGCDHCMEELEISMAFQRDLKQVASEDIAGEVVRFSLLASLMRSKWVRGSVVLAAAAVLLLAVSPMIGPGGGITEVELTSITREDARPVVALDFADGNDVRLTREVSLGERPDGAPFSAVIIDRDGNETATFSGRLEGGKLSLLLESGRLADGNYLLRLNITEDGTSLPIAEYELHVSQGRE